MRMRRGSLQRGFTLVEVTITIAIIALVAAVIIPGMNNVSRADLRKAASGISVTIRSAFDDASLSGTTYRLVIEPGKATIKVEATEQSLTFDSRDGAFVAAGDADAELNALGEFPGDSDSDLEDSKKKKGKKDGKKDKKDSKKDSKKKDSKKKSDDEESAPGGPLSALMNINKLGAKSAASGFQPKGKYDLGDSVRIMDVWTDGMDAAAVEGESYLYFFPNGYTQEALIHLEDKDKRIFTIKVAPLTGKCSIEDKYIEVPK